MTWNGKEPYQPGFFNALQYKRDGDLYADMLQLQAEIRRLENDISQISMLVARSMVIVQEILLEVKSSNGNHCKSNDL